jgi:pyruvate carboxylase
MPGLVVRVMVQPGDHVEKGQKLISLEAMKMEMTIYAERSGRIAEVLVQSGTQVAAGDLLLRYQN